jgi:o-succinylbenzoate---CoA ligase
VIEPAIPDPVRAAAEAQPDAPAVIGPDGTVTYADLDRRVTAMSARLRAHGLRRGDRLAVYRPTDLDYLVLLLAAFREGVVVAPLSTRQPPAFVHALLDRIACRTLAAGPDDAFTGLDLLDFDQPPTDPCPLPTARWTLADPATLVFTSGSTGTPKAALHTLGNHVASARGVIGFFDLKPGDRWLLDLPLFHVGGLAVLVRCVLAGAAVVLPDGSLAETLVQQRVTHASFVATQLLRTLRDTPAALDGLKAILLGGSALPPALLDEAHARGLPVHASYGMTEMASTVTVTSPGATRAMLDTSGIVLPGRELRLADDGEILVRGDTLFSGYLDGVRVGRPDRDGWFPTGDLGVWEEVGGERMLRVVGRKDHLFISGGENVQPEEVEAALGRLPGVRRAVVVPVADAEFGQRPVAFVDAEGWVPEAWRDGLGRVLPRFKLPDTFYPWPDGADAGMKVSRAALCALAERLHAGEGPR